MPVSPPPPQCTLPSPARRSPPLPSPPRHLFLVRPPPSLARALPPSAPGPSRAPPLPLPPRLPIPAAPALLPPARALRAPGGPPAVRARRQARPPRTRPHRRRQLPPPPLRLLRPPGRRARALPPHPRQVPRLLEHRRRRARGERRPHRRARPLPGVAAGRRRRAPRARRLHRAERPRRVRRHRRALALRLRARAAAKGARRRRRRASGVPRRAHQQLARRPLRQVRGRGARAPGVRQDVLTLANHGRVGESVELFDRMARAEKFVPNAITFVAVLSACNHGGMVEEGRRYFQMMVSEYGIRPRIEHYGCMVDILARAGFIEEALDVVSGMNCRPDAIIWRSLLDACCKQNAGLELSVAMAKLALDVPDDAVSGVYVLLSWVYASAQRWNDVGMVWRLMSEEGLKMEPGFSSIEMDGLVHQFVDTSHPLTEEIYKKLDEIEQRLTSSGYKPNLSEVPMVAGVDRAKGAALRLHSERLAISFGLLKATDGAPIRILKNLRVQRLPHYQQAHIRAVWC